MTILTAKCNRCGKILKSNEIYMNYDGVHHCERCHNLTELDELIREFKDTKEWLEETHIADLKDLKKQILELKAKIE